MTSRRTRRAGGSCCGALMNVRMPAPVSDEFLGVQDAYLQEEIRRKGITDLQELEPGGAGDLSLAGGTSPPCAATPSSTRPNSQMLGCFVPCHGCIDNAIHSFAGVQLRLACQQLMQRQGHEEGTGKAKITPAYNLPCRYVLHTVGPIITGRVTGRDCQLLASCYPLLPGAGRTQRLQERGLLLHFRRRSFIFQTGWRRRLPSRRCGPTDKNRQTPWR